MLFPTFLEEKYFVLDGGGGGVMLFPTFLEKKLIYGEVVGCGGIDKMAGCREWREC